MTGNDGGPKAEYASPPCFMHELDPAWVAPPPMADPQQWRDVARWRKAERERLLAERRALGAAERARVADAVAGHLDRLLGDVAGLTVSAWWPIEAELDLRFWLAGLAARGAAAALPLVVERGRPLAFRRWAPGVRMQRGFWNIPVPAEGPEVRPDVALAPVVGFDAAGYRSATAGAASTAPSPRSTQAPADRHRPGRGPHRRPSTRSRTTWA